MPKRNDRRPTGVIVEGPERYDGRRTRIVSDREMDGRETITVGIADIQSFRDAIAHLRELSEGRKRLKQSREWSQKGAAARRRGDTDDVRRFALDYRRRRPGSTFNAIASALLKERGSSASGSELARLAKQVARVLK